uniref:Uncharacterized protein n=2 Tax=Anguilla anguilla TaxID=7936 RepID=A0A0E9U978_ANGAN
MSQYSVQFFIKRDGGSALARSPVVVLGFVVSQFQLFNLLVTLFPIMVVAGLDHRRCNRWVLLQLASDALFKIIPW